MPIEVNEISESLWNDANVCFLLFLVFAVPGSFTSFSLLFAYVFSWFPRSEVCAFVLGNICERFARRDLC